MGVNICAKCACLTGMRIILLFHLIMNHRCQVVFFLGGGVFFFIFLCILLSMKYTYIIISIDPRTAIRDPHFAYYIKVFYINPIDDNIDLGFRMINNSYIVDIDTIYIYTYSVYIYICSYIFKSKNRCSNHILHTIYLLWLYYKYINI